jgi:hypothetical protein
MLRKLWIVGIAGVLVAVAAGGVTAALASSNITQPETIVLNDETVKAGYVDSGKPGDSIGDAFMFVDSLTDPADGSAAGKVHGQCVFQLQHWALCTAGAFIGDRGEVLVEGWVRFTETGPSTFDLAVIGGTGEFDNVRGSLQVEELSNTRSVLTFSLIP